MQLCSGALGPRAGQLRQQPGKELAGSRQAPGRDEGGPQPASIPEPQYLFSQVTQESLQFCALAVAISSSWVMAERARALPVPQTLANNILVTHLSSLIRRGIPQ